MRPERRLNWKLVRFSRSRPSFLTPLTPLNERGPGMSDGIDTDGDKTEDDKEWRAVWKNPVCFYTRTLHDLLLLPSLIGSEDV